MNPIRIVVLSILFIFLGGAIIFYTLTRNSEYSHNCNKEYLELFSEHIQPNLYLVFNQKGNVKPDLETYALKYERAFDYTISIYKFNIVNSISIDSAIILKSKNDILDEHQYIDLPANYELLLSRSPGERMNFITLSLYGDSVTKVPYNDSEESFNLILDSASFYCNNDIFPDLYVNTHTDRFYRRHFEIYFKKSPNGLYVVWCSKNDGNNLPSNFLKSILKD